nr:hypothetical protein [Mesorhizobium sp.]
MSTAFPAGGYRADVERQADRLRAGRGDLRHGLVEFEAGKVGERDPLAVCREAKSGRETHPSGAARDQDRPASHSITSTKRRREHMPTMSSRDVAWTTSDKQ